MVACNCLNSFYLDPSKSVREVWQLLFTTINDVFVGWYVPRYVLDDVPEALFGDFANPRVAEYFNNTLILGDTDWMVVEENIIKDQNYSLNIQYLGGEGDMAQMLTERYARKEQMLFYFWQPHTLDSIYNLMRVQLPNDCKFLQSSACTTLTHWLVWQRTITHPRFLARLCGQICPSTVLKPRFSRSHSRWTAIKWLNCSPTCTSTGPCSTLRVSGCKRMNRSGSTGFVHVSNVRLKHMTLI